MSVDLSNHPIALISRVASSMGADRFSFSRYLYRPRAILDPREELWIEADELSDAWFSFQLTELEPEWELAMNSLVVDARGRRAHLGMIDFVGRPDSDEIKDRIWKIVGKREAKSLVLFDSGRSLHGYIPIVIGPKGWQEFMARLMLVNYPDDVPMIDTRWIGHRLLGGYAALRWSANSTFHKTMPKLVLST